MRCWKWLKFSTSDCCLQHAVWTNNITRTLVHVQVCACYIVCVLWMLLRLGADVWICVISTYHLQIVSSARTFLGEWVGQRHSVPDSNNTSYTSHPILCVLASWHTRSHNGSLSQWYCLNIPNWNLVALRCSEGHVSSYSSAQSDEAYNFCM